MDRTVIGGRLINDLKLRMVALISLFAPFLPKIARAAPPSDAEAAGACAACGGSMMVMILLPVVIQVAILVYVVKDARARGMESALGWMAFVFLVPLVGILVYIFSRPPIKTQ